MGKFRSKLKGQTKGKRWAKGQSSSSNPQSKTYREQARSRFFQANIGSTGLTATALLKHDAAQSYSTSKIDEKQQETKKMDEQDTDTVYTTVSSYNTLKSFASEWSGCTNLSFNRFLNIFRPDSAIHKEMLAILAAITEVIKQQGGNETATEYYCALLTTLEQLLSSEQRSEDQISATLSLLNMGINSVPVPVLRSTFASVTHQLLPLLSDYATADNNLVVKSILGVLGVLLKQQELAVWQLSQTQQIYAALLDPFSIHSKPKWRRAAQTAVISVLNAEVFTNEQNYNPAADKAAEFCLQTLESCLGSSNSNSTILASSVQAGQTTILHILGLMKSVIVYFNKSRLKSCAETILRLMSLNYPIVTSCGLQVLHSLFSAQKIVVTGKLNAQIIAALYDYQPSAVDSQPTLAWLAVMQQAHIHLADVDLAMCSQALPKILSVVSQLWLSQNTDIVMGATRSLEMLLKDAVSQIVDDAKMAEQHEGNLQRCFQSVALGLSYQYSHAWPQVLHIIAVMFEVCGGNCGNSLLPILQTLSQLRDSYKFSYNSELENAVGAAVKAMGAEAVLSVIPLRKDSGEMNLNRSWLLPLLRAKIHHSTLEFWIRGILPLALQSQKRAAELGERNDGIGAHSAELMHLQLWNLLPSFCNRATDIHASFKCIAKVLGMAISDKKDVRLAVMASLRKLIACAQERQDSDDIHELARFDKNYLPILFNLYTTKPVGTDEEGQRLAAMDTIKCYLKIARPEMVQQLFDSAVERITAFRESSEGDLDAFVKESILDLIKTLIPYQSAENIAKIYEICIKDLPEMQNNHEQKKAYRMLEVICGSAASGCVDFLQTHRKHVQKLLRRSLSVSATSSKGARLRCLHFLIKSQPHLDYDAKIIKSTIPEAILGCKDVNQKCRLVSYEILNTIGNILLEHDQMPQFVSLIIAGLAGTTELMSATLLGLASILHHFTGSLGQESIRNILDNVLQLMTVPTREVVGGCLSFVKVFITCLPSPLVAAHLNLIVKALCAMTNDCQRHFRSMGGVILRKLVRKFGCDAVIANVPTTDVILYRRLRNIRKLERRSKRQKGTINEDDENDEFIMNSQTQSIEEILADSDSDFDQPAKKTRKFNTFIEEDADSIVDFKDPNIAHKILTSKPVSSTKEEGKVVKEKERGFKTAADGRLIITDLKEDDCAGRKQRNVLAGSDTDSEADGDSLSKAATEVLRDSKRKRSETPSSFHSKYRAGGSGIHRNVKRPPPTTTGSVRSEFGSIYKSKKAKGDMKQKGKVDPYAYLPLQRNALNRRKRLKHAGQFKSIIGGAQAGSRKGIKSRKRLTSKKLA